MRAITYAAVLAAGMSAASVSSQAKETSPIFGGASVQLTTEAQDKGVVGKGAWADYYGYYGLLYTYYAWNYGYNGYTYGSASNYYAAYQNASTASNNYYNAYIYQTYGY